MIFKRALLVSVLVVSLTNLSSALAETPEEALTTIVGKLRTSGEPTQVADFVAWDVAFTRMPDRLRRAQNVSSPEEMRAYFLRLFTEPEAVIREQFNRQLQQFSPDMQQMASLEFERVVSSVSKHLKQVKEDLRSTNFQVGKSTIENDRAKVKLRTTVHGKDRESEVELVRKGERWKLASLDMVVQSGKDRPVDYQPVPTPDPAEGF